MRMLVPFLLSVLAVGPVAAGAAEPGWLSAADTNAVPDLKKYGFFTLLLDRRVDVGDKGLKTVTVRKRVKILKPEAVERIGDISIPYNAFHSEARLVEAFTESPGGERTKVSKKNVHDLIPEDVAGYKMYSDVRTLAFSMPAVQPGAILDFTVEIEDRKAVMPGHFWDSFAFDSVTPVLTARYTVVTSARMPLRTVARNRPADATVTTNRSRVTRTWTALNRPGLPLEPGMPVLRDVQQTVHVTSVPDWKTVHDWYAALVRDRLEPDAAARRAADEVTAGAAGEEEKIRRLLQFASQKIRYVGVELGRSAYRPHAAENCLQNQYGDCKDKSALLVSMLKHAGIPAFIALANPLDEGEVVSEAPSPGAFCHAIVHVPRPGGGGLWLDPTHPDLDVFDHPEALDGTRALTIDGRGEGLATIPPLPAARNATRQVYEMTLHPDGSCRLMDRTLEIGRAGAGLRHTIRNFDPEKFRKLLANLNRGRDAYLHAVSSGRSDPDDLSRPAEHWLELDRESALVETAAGLVLTLSAEEVAGDLRVWAGGDASEPRRQPFAIRHATRREVVYRLRLPEGFRVRPPEPGRQELPHAVLEFSWTNLADAVELRLSAETRPATIPAAEVRDLAGRVERALARVSRAVVVEDEVLTALRQHKPAEAGALIRGWLAKKPGDPDLLHRLGLFCAKIGRFREADARLREAMKAAPARFGLYRDLAQIHLGALGRPGPGLDCDRAAGVWSQAVGRVANTNWARLNLGRAFAWDDQGDLFTTNAALDRAESVFQAVLRDDPDNAAALMSLGQCALGRDRFEEAEEYFHRAAQKEPQNGGAAAGARLCAVLQGRVNETVAALKNAADSEQELVLEIGRLVGLMLARGRYDECRQLAAHASRLTDASRMQPILKMLDRLETAPVRDYAAWCDTSTPENALDTYLVSILRHDTGRLARCATPWLARRTSDEMLSLRRLGGLGDAADGRLGADLVCGVLEKRRRDLDNGDVEFSLVFPADARATSSFNLFGDQTSGLLRKDGDGWRLYAFGDAEDRAVDIAREAVLRPGNGAGARVFADQIAAAFSAPAGDREGPARPDLTGVAFPAEDLRSRAYIAAALAGSENLENRATAARLAREVAAAVSNSVPLDLALGGAFAASGARSDARRCLERVLENASLDERQIRAVCDLALDLHEPDLIEKSLARLEARNPALPELYVMKSRLAALREDAPAAAALAREARSRGAEDDRVFLLDLQAMEAGGDRAGLRAKASAVSTPLHRAMLAGVLTSCGENEAALPLVESLYADLPMPLALAQLGKLLAETGQAEEADEAIRRARLMDTPASNSQMLMYLLMAEGIRGRHAETAALMERLADRRSSESAAYEFAFCHLMYRAAGRADQAARCLDRAATLAVEGEWPHALVHWLRGKATPEDVRRQGDAEPLAARRRDHLCEWFYVAGHAALLDGRRDEAVRQFEECVKTGAARNLEYSLAKARLAEMKKP